MVEFAPYIAVALSAAIWLWFIRRHDKFEPEPLRTLISVLAFGGLASIFPAAILNDWVASLFSKSPLEYDLGLQANGVFCLWVGLNEEFWKAVMTVSLISRHKDFNEPVDGIIYAMTCSLGFAAFENLFYIWDYGLTVIFTRSLLSVPAHLTCGAIWGYGMAKIRFRPNPGQVKVKYFFRMIPYVVLAGLGHAAYDLALYEDEMMIAIFILIVLILNARTMIKLLLNISPFKPAKKA